MGSPGNTNTRAARRTRLARCSWNSLLAAIETAGTFDDLIKSHETYLDNILYLGLLGEDKESREIQHLLSGLFDIADRFCAIQDRVFVDCLSELGGDRARNEVRRGAVNGRKFELLELKSLPSPPN